MGEVAGYALQFFHDSLRLKSRNAEGEHQGSGILYAKNIAYGNTTVYVTYITYFRMQYKIKYRLSELATCVYQFVKHIR